MEMSDVSVLIRPSEEEIEKYSGKSIEEMKEKPAPKAEEILGKGVLIKGAKACVYANAKVGKSIFATQLGLCCASGQPFLGIPVIYPCNVLYLNFEIDDRKMEERILEIKDKLKLERVPKFLKRSLLGEDVPLLDTDKGYRQVARIMEVNSFVGFPVELIIWDCRYKTVQQSENQDDVMKKWVRNMDELIKQFGFTLLAIHHKGKDTKGVGAGSSVFDRWVNTSIEIKPRGWNSALSPSKERKIIVGGNYKSGLEIPVVLDFPIHVLGGEEVWQKPLSKKDQVKNFILSILNGDSMAQEELEEKVTEGGHSRSTFFPALQELKMEGVILVRSDPTKPGRHNIIDSVLLPSEK
jgi:hypothetical protein